jgi:hypothetical protein
MKTIYSLLIAFSVFAAGCGKDSGGGGSASSPKRNANRNVNTAACANANYQNGRWYDYNGVELTQCKGIQNYMNSKYLLSYDNNNCMSRLYKKQITYLVNLNGVMKCASNEYFIQFGNNQIVPQYGHAHYVGFAPNSYYNHYGLYNSWPNTRYGYNNGTYCYGWGCDIGDGKWNFGDFAAIGLGAGLIFAIANQ